MMSSTGTEPQAPAQGPASGGSSGPGAAGQPTAPAAAVQRAGRLLLVEDDALLADLLARKLESAGYVVHVAGLGEDGLSLIDAHRFDAVLVDLSLPDVPGQAILRRLRQAGSHETPILILSGESDLSVKLEGFSAGADDYIVKPFHPDELVARVGAAIRRSQSSTPAEIRLGPLLVDLHGRKAMVNDQLVPLTGKEFQCLAFLAMRRGSTVTKEMFLAHLYGGRDEPEMKIIDVFICKIRRKLADAGATNVIETVWGRGYTVSSDG
ncbi:response regulator transcription factor [Thermaurantiacus sp.]